MTYLGREDPRVDSLLDDDDSDLWAIVFGKAAPELSHFVVGYNGQLTLGHSVAINENLVGQEVVHFLELFQRGHEGDLKRVGELLADHLKADLGVPSRVVVVQAGDEARDRLVLLVGLVVHVDADYHALLDGDGQAPQLATQLHVHLQDDLLGHCPQYVVRLVDSLQDYDLRGHRTLNAAEALDSGVPTVANLVEDYHHHLDLSCNQ